MSTIITKIGNAVQVTTQGSQQVETYSREQIEEQLQRSLKSLENAQADIAHWQSLKDKLDEA